ncbi:MAG: DUF3048 domain-containing protein [Tenericutes bacterium]|nr:DUF3048 domain-containing protein [Mycoplasmatota bacterium]
MKLKKKYINILVSIGLVSIFVIVGLMFLKEPEKVVEEEKEEVIVKPTKKLKIIDLDSNTRPIGVMIDNVKGAWPQAGLEEAYLIYDISVEWGLTRLFAIFKDSNANYIGPVRSARHYYLDYAMENDVIYTHHGQSPQALRDLSVYKINHVVPAKRVSTWGHISPHNVFTSISEINQLGKSLRKTTEKDNLLNYSVDTLSISEEEDAMSANKVNIKYSSSYSVRYEYNSSEGLYYRFINGNKHTDVESKKQLTTTNIIIINVKSYADPDNSDKGRITLVNVGTGNGYFVTNGHARPITWTKASREAQTVYKYVDGEEIVVNDGVTYIQIQPLNQNSTFE